MSNSTTHDHGATLENWQFALAPLTDQEQKRITIALAGIRQFAQHVTIDSSIGEMDFVAGCFADLVTEDLSRKQAIRKLLNHAFARALTERQ